MPASPARPDLRALIIEGEALIALYIQSAIEGVVVAAAEVVRDYSAASAVADRFAQFDLAIVNHPEPVDESVARRLIAACRAVVVCTGAPGTLAASSLAGAVALPKPFSEDDLIAACRRALGGAGPSS